MKKIILLNLGFFLILPLIAQNQDSIRKYTLSEITISAFRTKSEMRNLPHKVEVLQKHDIESIPSDDLGSILKRSAGVDVVEYPGFKTSVGIRGFTPTAFSPSYTLLLVNGIPAGSQNLSMIDVNNAEQIEILKGPFSAFYGSGAMAGIVNVASPHSHGKIKGEAGASLGSFGTYKLMAKTGGSINERFDFDVIATWGLQNKPYKTGSKNLLSLNEYEKNILDEKSFDTVYNNTNYNRYTAGFRLGYQISENLKINFYEDLSLVDNVYTNGTLWGVYGSLEKDILRWSHHVSLEGTSGNNSYRMSAWFSKEHENYYNNLSDTNYIESDNDLFTYGLIAQDNYKIGKHEIIVGIDHYSKLNRSHSWSDRDEQSAPYQPDYKNITWGSYVQTRLSFLDEMVQVNMGLRADKIDFVVLETDFMQIEDARDSYLTLNPNFGLLISYIPSLRSHFSIGTAFLAPDAFKKTGSYAYTSQYGSYFYFGNPDLKPEKSKSYDVGITYDDRKNGILMDVTYFDNKHEGLIVMDYSNFDTTTFINANEGYMNGVELKFSYDIGALADYKYSLKIYGNLTHLLNSDVKIGETTSSIKYVRKNNSSFGIEYRNLKSVEARVNARYIGRRYEDNWLYTYNSLYEKIPVQTSEGEPIRPSLINSSVLHHPDFLVFDLTCSYTLLEHYKLGVEIRNILDENYTEKDAYYMPGRAINFSFSYKF